MLKEQCLPCSLLMLTRWIAARVYFLFFIFIKNTVKFYNIKNNIFLILIIFLFSNLLIIIKIIIFIT